MVARRPKLSNLRMKGGESEHSRFRLLFWAACFALLIGVLDFGKPLEDSLRVGRNMLRAQDASGEIVVVAIDDESLAHLKKWPWPRSLHGELARNLGALGAKRIFFDVDFSSNSNPADDRALEEAFASLDRKVTLASLFSINPVTNERTDILPLPRFRRHVELANINLSFSSTGAVWDLPYALTLAGTSYPSFAASLANVHGGDGEAFMIDHSIDPLSIPTVSAADVVEKKVPRAAIAGKDVIVGAASIQLGDIFRAPGYGLISGVYLHVLGAETLKNGTPVNLGWFLPFLTALAIAGLSLLVRNANLAIASLGCGSAVLLLAPLPMEHNLIFMQVIPALILLSTVGGTFGWKTFRHAYRQRATINAVSGLPNLNALRLATDESSFPLIAARVQNFAEIISALPPGQEKSLVDQIAKRLSVGASDTKLYHGDEGIFAWFEDTAVEVIGDHLHALHTLFRNPVAVADTQFDLTVTFGIEARSDRSLSNRLASALVAADEAAAEGLKWKEYDPAKLKDAAWKLSLLSQLDAAIDSGDLWIAYQPKLDLATGKVSGAEALVRWTHPEKGPISPIEFISAAEQSDRIDKLTAHVLDGAIASAASINAQGIHFEIAVNLSARLIGDSRLVGTVSALLEKHGLPADRLILEVTETAAMANASARFETLEEMRDLGIQISIDDYGTGLSTLEYMKRIPASEIKIDRSFVHSMEVSNGDRIMVHSTIQLAHSLGRKVVAEGVEDEATLESLKRMGCDIIQGYLIGKPMTFRALVSQYFGERSHVAA